MDTAAEHLNQVGSDLPGIVNESLHFILEGNRAARSGLPSKQVREARALLKQVGTARKSFNTAALQRETRDTALHLDFRLAEIEDELRQAIRKMAPARSPARGSRRRRRT
jgi:hypothetical protein